MENSKKLSYGKVVLLGFLVYFFSYAMRLDYSASIVSIASDFKITNTAASTAVTASFISYGVCQAMCGFIGDRISPVKMIGFAMIGTIIVNFGVSFCSDMISITFLWCFNGFFQAMIWPPLCRFITEQVEDKKTANAMTAVSFSASFGTIFIYLFVPAVLKISDWRNVFRCMAILGFLFLFIWIYMTRGVTAGKAVSVKKTEENGNYSVWKIILMSGLVPIFILIMLQGFLRDGIQIWLPSLVKQQFGLDESVSILSSVAIPILSIISVIISNCLFLKFKNEIKTAFVFFAVAFAAAIPLASGLKKPLMFPILLAAMIAGCMHGVNHVMIAFTARRFLKFGMVSTFTGLLNSCTYVGATLSSYGFAAISDNFGWNKLFIVWCLISLTAALICVFKIKKWDSFIKE